jgi:hypothetical protein
VAAELCKVEIAQVICPTCRIGHNMRTSSRTYKIMKFSAGMFDVRLSPNSGTKADIVGGPRSAKCRHSLLGFLIRISFSLGDTTGAGMPNACPKVGGHAAGVPSLLHLCSMPLPSWAPYGSQGSMNLLTCVGH